VVTFYSNDTLLKQEKLYLDQTSEKKNIKLDQSNQFQAENLTFFVLVFHAVI